MSEAITSLAGFDEYATPEEARSYRAALQRYREAYRKVFHLPLPFDPNLTAVKKLLEAMQEVSDIEAAYAYRMGKAER